jgi:predicted O-methyltransferase YrrM
MLSLTDDGACRLELRAHRRTRRFRLGLREPPIAYNHAHEVEIQTLDTNAHELSTILDELRAVRESMVSSTKARMPRIYLEQLEAYISLIHFLQPCFPFPVIDKRAIAPELALLLASKIIENVPSLILEVGSGISTIVAGYCLKKNNWGKLISLEHDPRYAVDTRHAVRLHGLTDFVEVVDAPLGEMTQGAEKYTWYSPSILETIDQGSVELVFVDGPPGKLRKLSRYPALPILYEMLSENATILIDDANRVDESEMIRLWLRQFPSLRCSYIRKGKGIAIITAAK